MANCGFGLIHNAARDVPGKRSFMLTKTAIRILLHEKRKYLGVIIGVAMAVFLVLLQSAFYFGFRRDITVVADSFDVDLWISQREFLAFDYVAHFDDLPRWQALGDADVAAAMPVIVEWSRMRQLPDGATEDGQIVGLDLTAGIKINLGTDKNLDFNSLLSVPGNVLVDEKHLSRLGVKQLGETGIEIRGLNANIVGVMRGKKLFSTACLVATDLDNARRFLGLKANQITFVAVKCRQGANIRAVRSRLQKRLPEYHVWTAREFHNLTQNYWVKLTGIGPVLWLSAGLAALVGFLTVFLTFSHLTEEKFPVYAAMKAMGASTAELSGMVLLQIGVVFGLGCALAIVGVTVALLALSHTTISVVLTPGVALAGVGFMALCSLVAGLRALHKLASLEPAEAFKT
jgi:putative ABC transport system permease protein